MANKDEDFIEFWHFLNKDKSLKEAIKSFVFGFLGVSIVNLFSVSLFGWIIGIICIANAIQDNNKTLFMSGVV